MALNSLSKIDLNNNEYCYLSSRQHHTNSTFSVRIPKLIPLLSGTPKSQNVSYNNLIFANDSKIKPSVSSSMRTQNYLTVKRSANCSLEHLADRNGYIAAGTRLILMVHNNDPKDLTIIDG